MAPGPWLVAGLLWLQARAPPAAAAGYKDNVTVGYLMADMSSEYHTLKQGRIISGAMTYAIEQINADPDLLAGHHLAFMKGDTQASTLVGTALLIQQWREGAVAFFGPEDSCDTEARVAAALNLPMISYVSAHTHTHILQCLKLPLSEPKIVPCLPEPV